jgi:sialate O-acetylesterase
MFLMKNNACAEGTKWDLHLPPQPSGGPHKFSFAHIAPDGNTTTLDVDGVLFGDVWLCLGEGNMEYFFKSVSKSFTLNC